MNTELIGLWLGALFIVMVYSGFLYKETVWIHIAEHVFVGSSVGYLCVLAIKSIADNAWTPLVGGKYLYILPIILGLMLFLRYSNKTSFLSRWPLAIMIGVGTGLAIKGVVIAWLIKQVVATTQIATTSPAQLINGIIVAVGVMTGLVALIETREHTGMMKPFVSVGRTFLMAYFGVAFGMTVMTRFTILFGGIEYILRALRLVT
jgi:uncharacterized membrane protein YeiB